MRASKSRQNHSSVCSGSPLRSRPVKGQPPAPNARLGAAPPCELQPRRWPPQLTLREACPGSGMKGGCFSVRPRIGMYRTAELTTHQNLTALASNLNHPSTRFRPGQDVPQGRPAWLGGSQKRSEPGADRFRDMPAPGESPMALTLNVRKERQVH